MNTNIEKRKKYLMVVVRSHIHLPLVLEPILKQCFLKGTRWISARNQLIF